MSAAVQDTFDLLAYASGPCAGAGWVWAKGDWPRCAGCGTALAAADVDDADVAQLAHVRKVTPRPVHDTPAILHAVMTDPLPARQTDRQHIEAAIRAAAAEHGGYVTAAWVRPHITRDVLPQMVGAVMRKHGLLEPTGRLERNAGGSGNALKWSPVWRLIPLDTRKH